MARYKNPSISLFLLLLDLRFFIYLADSAIFAADLCHGVNSDPCCVDGVESFRCFFIFRFRFVCLARLRFQIYGLLIVVVETWNDNVNCLDLWLLDRTLWPFCCLFLKNITCRGGGITILTVLRSIFCLCLLPHLGLRYHNMHILFFSVFPDSFQELNVFVYYCFIYLFW